MSIGGHQSAEAFWKPASNGAGKRHWGAACFGGLAWAKDKRGRTIWVGSFEAAQRLADRMNRESTHEA